MFGRRGKIRLMFIAQVDVTAHEWNDEIWGNFNSLLGSWRRNGQILGKEFPVAQVSQTYRAFLSVPERDSLDAIHDNEYSKHDRNALESQTKIEIHILGIVPETNESCECAKHSFLVLFTHFLSLESALKCGDCFQPIPIYSLPKSVLDYGIMSWQSDYKACDTLQMGCSTGEEFGIREMSQHESSLSNRGRETCEVIENATQTPTFYYLYHGDGKDESSEDERKCPSCGGEWLLETKLHDLFDFKCDACRLLSNIAFSF